jgi:two-component system response regulator YesN
MLESFLKTGTYEEAEPFMEGVFDSVGEKNLGSYLFLTYLSMDLYFSMVRFLKELGRRVDEIDETCGNINTLLKNRVTVDEARDYLTRYLKELILKRDHNAEKRYGKILRDAVSYIDDNFARDDISLNRVAQTVGMSPNHFSSIFSQEMGETFIEYLINRRMERARELLRTTQMRSSEVAYQVGYRDPHYFSSTFKKIQGMTPREYRMSCQETGK